MDKPQIKARLYLTCSAQLNKHHYYQCTGQKLYLLCAANCVIAFACNQSSSPQLQMSVHVYGFSSLHGSSALGHGVRVFFPVFLSPHEQSGSPVACPLPRSLTLSAACTPQEGPPGWGDTPATSIFTVQSSSGENPLQLATFHTCF